MKTRAFLSQVEHEKVQLAIKAAEHRTAGNLVVYITHRPVRDPMASALRVFKKLRLETEKETTGLLIFVAPASRNFAVLGGTALHEKLQQPWWDKVAGLITAHFKKEQFTHGLLAAIEESATAFRTHFPSARDRPKGEIDIYDR